MTACIPRHTEIQKQVCKECNGQEAAYGICKQAHARRWLTVAQQLASLSVTRQTAAARVNPIQMMNWLTTDCDSSAVPNMSDGMSLAANASASTACRIMAWL